MKKPSQKEIKAALKKLRRMCEQSPNPAESRIAQAMETAIRWATEKTHGWSPMDEEARQLAIYTNEEIRTGIAKEITQ